MAQYAGYAFFFAVRYILNRRFTVTYQPLQHPDTPLFYEGRGAASPILMDAIVHRLQAQLSDTSNRVMIEDGKSITIPYNSPAQVALPQVHFIDLL